MYSHNGGPPATGKTPELSLKSYICVCGVPPPKTEKPSDSPLIYGRGSKSSHSRSTQIPAPMMLPPNHYSLMPERWVRQPSVSMEIQDKGHLMQAIPTIFLCPQRQPGLPHLMEGVPSWLGLAWLLSQPPRSPEIWSLPDRQFPKLWPPELHFMAADGRPQLPDRKSSILPPGLWSRCKARG